MKRRDFLEWGAVTAATGLLAEPAFARGKKKKQTLKGPGRRGRSGRGPAYVAPDKPLPLGKWKYGKNSSAKDTVLMFRGNPAHTFYGTGPIKDKLRMHWKFRMEDFKTLLRGKPKTWAGTGWTGTAAKLGNYVFVGSVGRNMYAFEAMTGKVAWRYRAPAMWKGSVTIYDNKLYAGNTDNKLYCFDAKTGKVNWRFDTYRDLDSSPCVVNDRLYISGENGNARCINPHTGKQIWKTFLGGIGPGTKGGSNGSETSPAVADGEFYAATYDGDLFSLRTSDGKRRWKSKTHADTDASPVIYGDMVYAAGEEESPRVRAFARKDGKEIWNFKASVGFWSTPAIVKNRLYVGCDNRRLYCLDAKSGKHIWDYKTKGAMWSSPCVVDGKVIVGSNAGYLYMFDAKTGKKIWEHRTPGGGRVLSSPCVVGGYVWIGTATGWFMCFGP